MDLETNKMNVNDLYEDMIADEEVMQVQVRTTIEWEFENQMIEDSLLEILEENKKYYNGFETLHFPDIFPDEKIKNNKKLKNSIKNHKNKYVQQLTNEIVKFVGSHINKLLNKIIGSHLTHENFMESDEYIENKEIIDYIFNNYLDLCYPDKVYLTIKKNLSKKIL